MNFVLDTNVISEPMKARPNAGVLARLAKVDENSVFLVTRNASDFEATVKAVVTPWT
jgi:predicted nucleic acid-binding protein